MMQHPPALPHDEPTGPASVLARVFLQEDINFLVTNRLPRRFATRLVGRLSPVRSRPLTRVTVALWRLFADDLRLDEARTRDFESLHDCFVRELKPGARPLDPDPEVLVSPCDGVIGAHGRVKDATVFQAKGFPYRLIDLLHDPALVARYEDGVFVTIRLKSNMYHRFHAPTACRVTEVNYISGDTWNVNPIALRRVERLFCRNERVVLDLDTEAYGRGLTLVPVAAILVASMHLHCLGQTLDLRYKGANRIACDAGYGRGDELGYFHAGSTILVFADARFEIDPSRTEGSTVRMGERLLRPVKGESRHVRHGHMDVATVFGEGAGDLGADEDVREARVQELLHPVDGVVVRQRDEVHPALLEQGVQRPRLGPALGDGEGVGCVVVGDVGCVRVEVEVYTGQSGGWGRRHRGSGSGGSRHALERGWILWHPPGDSSKILVYPVPSGRRSGDCQVSMPICVPFAAG